MNETDPSTPPKSSIVFLRGFAKSWGITALSLVALFGAVYFMLWKHYCPKAGECDAAFKYVREIFGRMLWTGAAIAALGGWGIYRAYLRMK